MTDDHVRNVSKPCSIFNREISSLTELVLTDSGDSAIQLESGQRQVVSLTAGVLPHLFDPDVSPALLLLFGRVQRPRGRRPDTHTHTQLDYNHRHRLL